MGASLRRTPPRHRRCQHCRRTHLPADGKDHTDVDVAIAVEHICLAAAEAGLGTCWVCAFDVDAARRALPLKADEEPVIILPVGYPTEGAVMPEKNRKTLGEIVTEI